MVNQSNLRANAKAMLGACLRALKDRELSGLISNTENACRAERIKLYEAADAYLEKMDQDVREVNLARRSLKVLLEDDRGWRSVSRRPNARRCDRNRRRTAPEACIEGIPVLGRR